METSEAPQYPKPARRATGWLVAWGLVVWDPVAVTVRPVGHRLLDQGSPVVVAAFFVTTVPLMALVTYPIYRSFGVASVGRPGRAP